MPESGIPFVGGAEVQQAVQMRALQRAGHKISVLVMDYGQPDIVDVDGIVVYKVPDAKSRGIPGVRFIYPRMTDIVRLLSHIQPDVVFIQTASEQVASCALYAKLFRKKFIFAGASDTDFKLGSLPGMPPQHALLYRMGLRAADVVIVQNSAQSRMLTRNFGRHGCLIQNGYEEPAARSCTFGRYNLWVATVKPLKRPDLFLALARRIPHQQFVMVGGPEDAPDGASYYSSIRADANRISNLCFVGYVPFHEVGRYFDGASLFVNTSDYEGFPNTFLQAWLRGVPSVSFVRPESADGSTGTISCGNMDSLTEQVLRLTSDRARWQEASDACRRHFRLHNSMEAALDKYQSVFDGSPNP
jgi:glycosyltransferase involved in cell wall biosynthesis